MEQCTLRKIEKFYTNPVSDWSGKNNKNYFAR